MEILKQKIHTKPYIQTCLLVIHHITESDPSELPSGFYRKSLNTASCKMTCDPDIILHAFEKGYKFEYRNRRQVVNHKSLEHQKIGFPIMKYTIFIKLHMLLQRL